MPTFEDLVGNRGHTYQTTLAYWIGSLKQDAPVEHLKAEHLFDAMVTMYDVEDQCCAEEYGEIDAFTDSYFQPVAPVTLTRKWCPLDSAAEWLGKPFWQEVEDSPSLNATAALWKQLDHDALDDISPSDSDEAHFLFLLQLTLFRCVDRNEHALIVCSPGWCFEHAAKNPLGIFGYSALSAGRLYSERVPSGSVGIGK